MPLSLHLDTAEMTNFTLRTFHHNFKNLEAKNVDI